ncbi:MAG: DMT family transporter [Clostridia bacterium]|nr:DMT family transporter [Clostridia bacterium]
MQKLKKDNLIGQLLLVLATLAWGSSFVILKETIDNLPPIYVIAVRFLVASILFGIIFFKRVKQINKGVIFRGVIIGLCLAFAYLTQTFGLKRTTPARNAFITSLYCVMTPFFVWLIVRVKPKLYNLIALVICAIGIGFITFSNSNENAGLNLGDFFTFLGAIGYALQIVFIDMFANKNDDPIQLLIVELFFCGIILSIYTLCFEIPIYGIQSFALNGKQIINIIYLTLACTLFAQFALLIGQKKVSSSQSAVILSLEAVFGAMFSIIVGMDKATPSLIIGFAIVFIGTLISELKIDLVKIFKKKKAIEFNEEDI